MCMLSMHMAHVRIAPYMQLPWDLACLSISKATFVISDSRMRQCNQNASVLPPGPGTAGSSS